MDALLAPLDVARARALRWLGPRAPRLLARRDERVLAVALASMVVALACALVAPVLAFAVGPIALGVPHVVSDLRYLIARPRLHARASAALIAAPLVATLAFPTPTVGLLAPLAAALVARASWPRRVGALVFWLVVTCALVRGGAIGSAIVIHGHNVVAVLLWCACFARRRASAAIVAAAFAALSAGLLAGGFDALLLRGLFQAAPRTALGLDGMVRALAPVEDPTFAIRLVVFFVFAQGVHYAIWLRVVPDDARERPGLRSFRSTYRALAADVGPVVIAAAAALALALLVVASASVEHARVVYLRASGFHAHLELAFVTLAALERKTMPSRP